jgi:hypothetical protein
MAHEAADARLVSPAWSSASTPVDLDRADAVNVALAAHHRTDAVLALDRRDFRAMQPVQHEPGSHTRCSQRCSPEVTSRQRTANKEQKA